MGALSTLTINGRSLSMLLSWGAPSSAIGSQNVLKTSWESVHSLALGHKDQQVFFESGHPARGVDIK